MTHNQFTMDSTTVICCGYLKKSPPERRLMRTWHKRYFVLKSDKTLTYYPSEKDKRPVKGPIDLNLCQSIEANLHHKDKNFKHVFSIITASRTYYLVADSREDMDKWVKQLCKCCGFEKQDGKPSPDFVRNRSETKPKEIINPVHHSTLPSPKTSSPPPVCPLSPPKSPSMPLLNDRKDRSYSDPPDNDDIMRRAERQYIQSKERRKSSEIGTSPGQPNLTLPLKVQPLSQLPEFQVQPHFNSQSQKDVDGGYDSLKPPTFGTRIVDRQQPLTNYDVVPRPRPLSEEMHDTLPKQNRYSKNSDEDIYDIPPTRNSDNYDIVPPPRPVSQNDVYDCVPRQNRNSYNPEENYDILPTRHSREEECYEDMQNTDVYDIVPPPRQQKSDSDYYDTLPSPHKAPEDFYNMPLKVVAPARPPKASVTAAKDHYDIVPPPSSKKSMQRLEIENRDSGSYSDDIYDVPPKPSIEDDIYDVPPKPSTEDDIYDVPPKPSTEDDTYDVPPRLNDADVYDELPRHNYEDCYDTPPSFGTSGSDVPPMIDRSIKPPPICRSMKPANHDYTNLAPPVDRKSKPAPLKHTDDRIHPYENLPRDTKQSELQEHHQIDDYDMQPFRTDDTRCYSFSKDTNNTFECYEVMGPGVVKRESGVHSNSSSEDGETDESYMTMEAPEIIAQPQRKAALQYCEVQIVEGQTKCQVSIPRRNVDSHYTTINEESTQAFLQTCRQQKSSRN